MEGFWEIIEGVFLLFFVIFDEESKENYFEIFIFYGVSLIFIYEFKGEIKGLNEFEGEYLFVVFVFFGFRVMVGMGMLMFVVLWFGSFYFMCNKDFLIWFKCMFVGMVFSGWIVMLVGWYVMEIGC